jgi:membrane-bound lytic murein transglycosylase D
MIFICKIKRNILSLTLFSLLLAAQSGHCSDYKNYFPSFQTIKNNVLFWEKIFAEVSINTAVFHDRENLSILYEAVELVDRRLPGADTLNQKHLQTVRKKYVSILSRLAAGTPPITAEEKRVYAMFSPPDIAGKLQAASQNIRIQTGLKERFIEGVIQSGAYMEEMKKIFRSYNLPEDLVYIPHVESSFNIQAYSKFGAAGIWQFTHSTGMEYLTIDYVVDERRDPLLATDAAARYLKKSFESLGTWPLAITAYNYGHAGMKRALLQEGTYENIFRNYRQGHFKFASRNFYAEFLAARNVAKKIEQSASIKMARPLPEFPLGLPGYVHINDIINHFQLSRNELQKLNPSLRPPIWQGERYLPKGFLLRLPYSPEIVRLANSLPSGIFKAQQQKPIFYQVKRGDTAGAIAKRFGITLRELSNANTLDDNALVYIGQTLHIPGKAGSTIGPKSSAMQQKGGGAVLPGTVLQDTKKSSPVAKTGISFQPPPNYILDVTKTYSRNGILLGEIIVQPEETLSMYSEWLKISKSMLYSVNGIPAQSSIHAGRTFLVPFVNISREDFENRRREFHRETEEDFFSAYKITGFSKYLVATGDTLWQICRDNFDLPIWLLKRYNSELSYDGLLSNQYLQIPVIEPL